MLLDGGMIDSQSLSLKSKPALHFPNSGGRKSDCEYMYCCTLQTTFVF